MILLQAFAWNSVRMLNWLSVPCMHSVHDHDNSLVRHASHLRVGALALRDQGIMPQQTICKFMCNHRSDAIALTGHSWLTA